MGLMPKIRKLREARRSAYSQEQVASAIGVSAPTYRKLEENPELLTLEQAEKLAIYLGCDQKEFFEQDDESVS